MDEIELLILDLEDISEVLDRNGYGLWARKIQKASELLKEQEEIVRCKECINATMTADEKLCKYCANDTDENGNPREVYHDANWFCPDGKRG